MENVESYLLERGNSSSSGSKKTAVFVQSTAAWTANAAPMQYRAGNIVSEHV